jgi:[acyl-carrier-protein] S-malonyltransferase
MSVAFMFPGTNTERVGMGFDLYVQYSRARDLYQQADGAVGFDLSRICFQGPSRALASISCSHPAVVAHSVVLMELMKDSGILPSAVCGHSLGEFAALVTAGVLSFPDAVRLVHRRARIIEVFCHGGSGSMVAIMGADLATVEFWCRIACSQGVVEIANHNGPSQFVVSGQHAGLRRVEQFAVAAKGCRCVRLGVPYAFHSRHMRSAENALASEFSRVQFKDAVTPIACNYDGSIVTSGAKWRELLLRQLCGPVWWDRVIASTACLGVSTFIELGPGKVLQGLVRRITAIGTLGAEGCEGLEQTIRMLQPERMRARIAVESECLCAT